MSYCNVCSCNFQLDCFNLFRWFKEFTCVFSDLYAVTLAKPPSIERWWVRLLILFGISMHCLQLWQGDVILSSNMCEDIHHISTYNLQKLFRLVEFWQSSMRCKWRKISVVCTQGLGSLSVSRNVVPPRIWYRCGCDIMISNRDGCSLWSMSLTSKKTSLKVVGLFINVCVWFSHCEFWEESKAVNHAADWMKRIESIQWSDKTWYFHVIFVLIVRIWCSDRILLSRSVDKEASSSWC